MPIVNKKYVCTLPKDVQKIAELELHEDHRRRDEDIQALRLWIDKQPHLRARTDTLTLLRYLRGCKFSIEKAKKKIEMYYTLKGSIPELFQGRDPNKANLRAIFHMKLMLPLPGYDQYGRKVILGRLGAWNPSEVTVEDLFMSASMLFDVLFKEDEQNSVTGFVQVHDVAGISLKHVTALNPTIVKKAMSVWTKCYPTRPKAIHYLNNSGPFQAIAAIFDKFCPEKMRKRIFFHGSDIDALYKHIPKEMFPKEYGGTSSHSSQEINDYWIGRLDANREWFIEEDNYFVDESRRFGKSPQNDLYGVEGSFRKLEFD